MIKKKGVFSLGATMGMIALVMFSCASAPVGKVTPLHEAAVDGSSEGVHSLIKAGANVNAADPSGLTPLMYASAKGHIEIAKILLTNGAKVNLSSYSSGTTALKQAALTDNIEMLALLLENGAKIDQLTKPDSPFDIGGFTALMLAAQTGKLNAVQFLISKGANVNAHSPGGISALLQSSGEDSMEVVKSLVEAGADVNYQDKDGESPLFRAKDDEIILFLIKNNANVSAKKKNGWSVLDDAFYDGLWTKLGILLENDADIGGSFLSRKEAESLDAYTNLDPKEFKLYEYKVKAADRLSNIYILKGDLQKAYEYKLACSELWKEGALIFAISPNTSKLCLSQYRITAMEALALEKLIQEATTE